LDTSKLIYYGLLGLCLVTLLLYYKRLGKEYIMFLPLIVFAILTQVIGDVVNQDLPLEEKKSFMFHIYQPIEYSLLALFYYQTLMGRKLKTVILITIPLFIIFCVYYYSSNSQSFSGPDFTDFTVEAILICIFVIIFFSQLLNRRVYLTLTSYPSFWINTGNLIFYAGNLLVMGAHFYISKQDVKLAEELLVINHYSNLFLCILYLIGFGCLKKKKWSQQLSPEQL